MTIFSVQLTHEDIKGDLISSETYVIDGKYIEQVKLELVKYELKSEGIDP